MSTSTTRSSTAAFTCRNASPSAFARTVGSAPDEPPWRFSPSGPPRKERNVHQATARDRARDLEPRAAGRCRVDGRADREPRRHVRVRDLDRRRLHRPAALLLRRDVEARGRDGLQADELAGQGRRRRRRRDPRGRARTADRLARRQDVHVHDQAGLPLLERQGGHGEKLRRLVQPLREPADAVDRRPVPRHRQGCPGRDRRQGAHDLGRQGERQQVRRPADEGVAGLPGPADDAVHAGDRHDACRPDRRERDQPVRLVRPVLLLEPHTGALDHPQAQPVLQGWPRGQPRHDPGQRRERHRRAVPERRASDLGLRLERHPADRVEERRPALRAQQEGRSRPGAGAPRRPLRRDEPLATALQGQPGPRQGRQLDGRPPGLLGPGRLPLRQANGADPAAGHARLQAAGPLSAAGHRRVDEAGEEARRGQPPRRQGRALVVEHGHRAAAGAADPVQPAPDRARRRDPTAAEGAAVHERRQPADRHVRHDDRAVGLGLRRPVRLRERPARRGAGEEPASTTTTRTSTSRSTTAR